MRIILLLPSQKSIYSNLYEVFADLNNVLMEMNIESMIVEIRMGHDALFPFAKIEQLKIRDLINFINSNSDKDTYFITVDDYSIIKWLSHYRSFNNFIVWAHYFYGHKFIFQAYRENRNDFPITLSNKIVNFLSSLIPHFIAINYSRFYWETLSRYPTFSQSLWTGLLLERVYSIPVSGNILIPVDANMYEISHRTVRNNILVFLGDYSDTSLIDLERSLKILDRMFHVDVDYFGSEDLGNIFEKKFGRMMNFIGRIERKELSKQYSSHLVTVAPVFNGTFEMVPIQSLLCGTPVISFKQPFLEVTGESDMIANIHNEGEIKHKVQLWKNLDMQSRHAMRNTILEKMDSRKVAGDLLRHLENLGFQ